MAIEYEYWMIRMRDMYLVNKGTHFYLIWTYHRSQAYRYRLRSEAVDAIREVRLRQCPAARLVHVKVKVKL